MPIKITVLPLSKKVLQQARRISLEDKLRQKLHLLEENFRHPSLRAKLLKPRNRGIWQIRLNRQYRAFLILQEEKGEIYAEVIYVGDPHR